MRLAIVLSHPVQYYGPWFRSLACVPGLHVRVFYLWDAGLKPRTDPRFQTVVKWDCDLLSGYETSFPPNRSPKPHTDHFFGLINPALIPEVEAYQPDAILLFGYRFVSHLSLIAWASLRRIPLIFRGDSHLIDRPRIPPLTRLLLAGLFSRFQAFACVGSANTAYFRYFGVPRHKLFRAPHAADSTLYSDPQGRHAAAAAQLRTQLGIPDTHKTVLFCGKFHPDKNPQGLLDAFLHLPPGPYSLIFAGGGPLTEPLKQAAHSKTHSIHFLPFANQQEMPARYLLGDIFCLPSTGLHETWGLAVNEAMMLGRPCLVSNRVGCQQDLIEDGVNGWVFRAAEPRHLEAKLREALEAPLLEFGQKARRKIATFGYPEATQGLLQAVSSCLPGRSPDNFSAETTL